MATLSQDGTSRSFSSHSVPVSKSNPSFLSSCFSSLHLFFSTRRFVIIFAFIVGTAITIIMKREHLLWLLATNAGAAPLLQWGQGSNFHFAGLRFGMDGNFKISVFEDLHFGEREWALFYQSINTSSLYSALFSPIV